MIVLVTLSFGVISSAGKKTVIEVPDDTAI
jgi:hypothetical protein